MDERKRYSLVKRNYYARKRMLKFVLRTAIVLDIGIAGFGVSQLFVFNSDDDFAKCMSITPIAKEIDFEQDISYLDMDRIDNQNLVRQLQEYQDSGYGSNFNALATLEEAYGLLDGDYSNYEEVAIDEKLSFEEETIMKYCAIYQVDYKTVYNKLFELTNGFSSGEYLNGTIPGVTFKKEPISFENEETLLAMAVRCCAQTPGTVGLTSKIKVDVKFESNMSLLEQVSDFANLFGLDRNEVYSIFRAENSLGSEFTDNTNNFGSLKSGTGFAKYPNVTQGVLEACAEIYKFKTKYNITEKGADFFKKVQPHYAPTEDVPEEEAKMNSVWLGNAIGSYREACSRQIFDDESFKVNAELDKLLYKDYAKMAEGMNQELSY